MACPPKKRPRVVFALRGSGSLPSYIPGRENRESTPTQWRSFNIFGDWFPHSTRTGGKRMKKAIAFMVQRS